jgi:hypothetical protein
MRGKCNSLAEAVFVAELVTLNQFIFERTRYENQQFFSIEETKYEPTWAIAEVELTSQDRDRPAEVGSDLEESYSW